MDISDLSYIIQSLKTSSYDVSTWSDLCLSLGLLQSRINTIKEDETNSNDCLKSCLFQWLKRVDQVDKFGGATWMSLVRALDRNEQKTVAESK